MSFVISTDDASPKRFQHHGRVEYESLDDSGELLHIRGFGPFNKEVLEAIAEIQNRPELLNPSRREVIEFFDTCLGIDDFLTATSEYVRELQNKGLAPKAVALVLSEKIEGKALMQNLYEDIYRNLGIPIKTLGSADEAFVWLGKAI